MIALFIVINIIQAVSVYFVIDQNDCEPFLINFIILDTFIGIFGSLNVLIEEHLDSREKLIGYQIINKYHNEVKTSLDNAKNVEVKKGFNPIYFRMTQDNLAGNIKSDREMTIYDKFRFSLTNS